MYKKILFLTVLFMFMGSGIAMADGPEDKVKGSKSPNTEKAGPQNSTKLGIPAPQTVVEVEGPYTLADWENDLKSLIGQINNIYPQAVNLVQNQENLIAKPDGKPYKNLADSMNRMYEMLSKAIDQAGEQDPRAMKAIAELREMQDKLDDKIQRVNDYLFGPTMENFLLKLTGEGRGIYELTLNNGETIEVRYAVGCDRSVTPTVTDYPVVSVVSMAPNQGTEPSLYAYFQGIAIRGEDVVLMQADPYPFDLDSAQWMAQRVHNLTAEDWQWICCADAECQPCSANAHDEDEQDKPLSEYELE